MPHMRQYFPVVNSHMRYASAMPTGKTPEPGMLAREFSARVRAVMTRDRVTAQALAKMTGLSRSYLGKRLRDEAPFNLTDVELIMEALKLSYNPQEKD